MPRSCTACGHPQRPAIDRALAERSASFRTIADRFGLSETSLKRHRNDHIPASLSTAHEAEAVADAGDLLGQVRELRRKALDLLGKAERTGDFRTALMGVREARACIELLLEVEGELDRRNVVNIAISPQWIAIRAVLIGALQPHPEARQAVAAALQSLEGGTDHASA